MTDLDELELLLAKATPGPWSFGRGKSGLSAAAIAGKMKQVASSSWHSCSDHYPTERETVANFEAITALHNAAPAMIAELKALRINAKANNDLAHMYKAQADELRGKCAALADTLDYIAPSLPVLRDILKEAKMPRGANTAADMANACETALAQYRRATAMNELIASTADEYGPQAIAKETPDADKI